jgi:hypothetical protein
VEVHLEAGVLRLVKLFMWRACHNLLPTQVNLVNKGVIDDASCPCCGSEEETVLHVLWLCPAAQDVWGGNKSSFQKCRSEGTSFVKVFEECLLLFDQDALDLLAVIARKIWLRRNSLVFEGLF